MQRRVPACPVSPRPSPKVVAHLGGGCACHPGSGWWWPAGPWHVGPHGFGPPFPVKTGRDLEGDRCIWSLMVTVVYVLAPGSDWTRFPELGSLLPGLGRARKAGSTQIPSSGARQVPSPTPPTPAAPFTHPWIPESSQGLKEGVWAGR